MEKISCKSDFIHINGVSLHYLDWGGNDSVLLFLAGMGCNAHIFAEFAPRFTDKFRVLALTRRGHGESDHPESGYDIDTLTEDVRAFLDELKVEKAILVGHSLAGIELSHFAASHPERLLKLVYLDAAFYRNTPEFRGMQEKNPLRNIQIPGLEEEHHSPHAYFTWLRMAFPSLDAIWGKVIEEQGMYEITILPDGKVIDRMTPGIESALNATLAHYEPEDEKIRVPTLSFTAFPDADSFISQVYMNAEQRAEVVAFFETTRMTWLRHSLEQFRKNVPQAKIIEIPHGHHYCFIQQEELVYREMRTFLLEGQK